MKILQINSDYGLGSTGKIVECIHNGLKNNNIKVNVCYGRDISEKNNTVFPCISSLHSKICHLLAAFTGKKYNWCYFSTRKVISIIKKTDPDIIHLQCLNGYFVNIPILLSWIARNKYKTVLTIHADFMYTGGCDHAFECEGWKRGCKHCNIKNTFHGFPVPNRSKYVFTQQMKAFNRFDDDQLYIVSVSKWMMDRATVSPMLKRFNHRVILNPVNTNLYYHRRYFRKEQLDSCNKFLFFPTAEFQIDDLDDNKGGQYIVELANKLLINKVPVKIVVAANYGSFKELPQNVVYIGRVTDQEKMSEYYSNAELTLLLSKRESFGMTVAESQCCGTPVIGFNAGGPESIAIKPYSSFVEYGDIDSLYKEVINLLNCSYMSFHKQRIILSNEAQKVYSQETIVLQHIRLYEEIV